MEYDIPVYNEHQLLDTFASIISPPAWELFRGIGIGAGFYHIFAWLA
jgi:hypothetical protein